MFFFCVFVIPRIESYRENKFKFILGQRQRLNKKYTFKSSLIHLKFFFHVDLLSGLK